MFLDEEMKDSVQNISTTHGKETEMMKDGAILQTMLGIASLMFNPESDKGSCILLGERMKVSKIEDLRAAIYQTSESEGELMKDS